MQVRHTTADDIPGMRTILDETGLFPSEMLPDMLGGFLSGAGSQDIWMTCDVSGQVVGFCYAAPEELTDGTWNMLAIGVRPAEQGAGYGGAIVRHLEMVLHRQGHRVLIAETSGKDEFSPARKFYRSNGYVEEARIRDFWGAGDDKVVFWKRLG